MLSQFEVQNLRKSVTGVVGKESTYAHDIYELYDEGALKDPIMSIMKSLLQFR